MKDTKKKDNFKTIVISSITFFGIIVFVLLVCVMCGRRGNNKPVDISTTINVNDYIKEDEKDVNIMEKALETVDTETLAICASFDKFI